MDFHKNLNCILSVISILVFATLACTALTGTQGNGANPPGGSQGEFVPVCTPPNCARNESYVCYDECPGGCGTSCAMFTPAPDPLYLAVDLVAVNLTNNTLEISLDVPGIQGDFYGIVSREDFECGLSQPEQNPERLFCKGRLWSTESIQTLRVYRAADKAQAFTVEFTIP
jgi:hypothetical protein